MAGDRMWSVISRQIALINIIRATFWWLVSSAYVDITDWITTSFRYLFQDGFPWFDEFFFRNLFQLFRELELKWFHEKSDILSSSSRILSDSDPMIWWNFSMNGFDKTVLTWNDENIVRIITNELWKRKTFYFIPYPQKSNA